MVENQPSEVNEASGASGGGGESAPNNNRGKKTSQEDPATAAQQKAEVIALTPVEELAEKLRQKVLLGREEVKTLTLSLSKEFKNDFKKHLGSSEGHSRLRDGLWLAFYALINTHPYSTSKDYLELSSVKNLVKEVLNLIKVIHDALQAAPSSGKKKDQQVPQEEDPQMIASLLNHILNPSLKILSLFTGTSDKNSSYDQQHYRYLRATSIKQLRTQSLGGLNQVLTEFGGQQQMPKKTEKKGADVEEIIIPFQKAQAPVDGESDEDFMKSMLEYVPLDYQAMAKSISGQIESQNNKQSFNSRNEDRDETMSLPPNDPVEEEKGEVIETFAQFCSDQVSKLKLNEVFGKTIDRLVSLINSERPDIFLLFLDTQLTFGTIQKYLAMLPNLKPKLFTQLMTKQVPERAARAQGLILEHFSKLKDVERIMSMETDQIIESVQGSEQEFRALQEHVQVLTKCLEIITKTNSSGTSEAVVDELIKGGENLKYLSKSVKSAQQKKSAQAVALIESLSLSFCKHLQSKFALAGFLEGLSHEEHQRYLIVASRLVIVTRSFNEPVGLVKQDASGPSLPSSSPSQIEPPKASSAPPTLGQNNSHVRTRGQMKKVLESSSSPKNAGAKGAGSAPAKGGNKQEKKGQKGAKEGQEQEMAILSVDANDLLKTSINLFTQLLPHYFKQSQQELALSADLMQNLLILATNNNSLICRVIYGLLTHFTRPALNYSQESLDAISKTVLKWLKKISQSQSQTIFAIKMLFLTHKRQPDLALKVATQLLEGSWTAQKGGKVSAMSEIYDSQNVVRYLLYIACLIILGGGGRDHLVQTLLGGLATDCPNTLAQTLILLQQTILSAASLSKLKPILHKFLTSPVSDSEFETTIAGQLSSDIEKVSQSLFNSQDQQQQQQQMIFDQGLLLGVQRELRIEDIVRQLKKTPEAGGSPSKAVVTTILKEAVRLTSATTTEDVQGKIQDLQQYLKTAGQEHPTWPLELSNSRYDMLMMGQSQKINQKLTQNAGSLSSEDLESVHLMLRSVKHLAQDLQNSNISLIRDLVTKNSGGLGQGDLIEVVMLCSKTPSVTVRMQKLLHQLLQLPFQWTSSENDFSGLVLDPSHLSKQVGLLRSHTLRLEDSIYAHCFSAPQGKHSEYFSKCLLVKSLFSTLASFLSHLPGGSQQDSVQREVALALLEVKASLPFLELHENHSGTFDFDLNERLISKSLVVQGTEEALGGRDYLKLRAFDHSLRLLSAAVPFISNNPSLNALLAEIVQNTFSFSQQFGTAQQTKLLAHYLRVNSQGSAVVVQSYFNQGGEAAVMGPNQIWYLALKYISLSSSSSETSQDHQMSEEQDGESGQINKEKKGGVQMIINFGPSEQHQQAKKSGPPRNRAALNARNKASAGAGQKHDDQQVPPKVQEDHPTQKQINAIGQRILTFIGDCLSVDKNSSSEHTALSTSFKMAFLRSTEDPADQLNFIQILLETGQIGLLKRLVCSLVRGDSDQGLKVEVQSRIYSSLVQFVQLSNAKDSETFIIITIELAQIITEDNAQLCKFIAQHILSRRLGSGTRLQVLDFLCQLAQSRFSNIEGDKLKFNLEIIQDRRRRYQEERKRQSEQKQQAQSQAAQEEKGTADNAQAQTIDGYKQGKLNREQDYLKYMERPEEVCTYTYTKKEFRQQHWYFCYTCKLTDNSGCCAVCVRRCHKGHNVVYSKKTNFFCDCGDSGRCQSLRPAGSAAEGALDNLQSDERPPSKRPRQEPVALQDRGMLFSQLIGGKTSQSRPPIQPPNASLFAGPPGAPGGGGLSSFGHPPPAFMHPPPSMRNPFSLPPEDFSGERPFQHHFGGILDPSQVPPSLLRHLGPEGMRILSESSEDDGGPLKDFIPQSVFRGVRPPGRILGDDDEEDEEEDDDDESDEDRDDQPLFGSVKHVMKFIKKVPGRINRPPIIGDRGDRDILERLERHWESRGGGFGRGGSGPYRGFPGGLLSKKAESVHSQSNISNINPLEDPYSDAGLQTPVNLNVLGGNDDNSFGAALGQEGDVEMKQELDELKLVQELIDFLKQEHSHFDDVFNNLVAMLDAQSIPSGKHEGGSISSLQEVADQNSSQVGHSDAKSTTSLLLGPKQKVVLVQDLTQNKKNLKDNSFTTKLQGDSVKNAMNQSLNLLNAIDSNKDGLVAVCEDQEVSLYAGSQFFSDDNNQGSNGHLELFNYASKEGGGGAAQVHKVDSKKLSFQPLSLAFNPSQPYYLAVAGPTNVEILVMSKQGGKVQQRVTVELMLEAISRELTVVNVRWLPGSQSCLAVATSHFIKIYDLSQDTLSPTHNIMIFYGFISDFTFSKHATSSSQDGTLTSTLYVASKQGSVYYQEITYKAFGSHGASSAAEDVKMKDDCDWMLTETLAFDSIFNIQENVSQCLSIYHCQQQDILLVSFAGGFTLVGRQAQNSAQFQGFKISVAEDPSFGQSSLKQIWQKYGETLVGFKELPSPSDVLYLTAFSRKVGTPINQQGIPVVIEISETKVTVNVARNMSMGSSQTIIPSIGLTYAKNSYKGHDSHRLLTLHSDNSLSSYTISKLEGTSTTDSVPAPLSFGGNLDMLMQKGDLPSEVILPMNFFEKARSLLLDSNLRAKLTLSGDLINYFKSSTKQAVETLFKSLTQNQVIINETGKKQIKFSMKIENSADFVITGIRIKLDFAAQRSSQHCPSLKLFNRVFKLKDYRGNSQQQQLWFDIPFCDAEVLFGSASWTNMQMELTTEDLKQCPLRIVSLDIFGLPKKEFGFKEKVRRLEKLNIEKLQKISPVPQTSSAAQVAEESIRQELLNTKQIPLVAWREKQGYLKTQAGAEAQNQQMEIIQALDIISQYVSITQSISKEMAGTLVDKVRTYLSHQGETPLSQLVVASAKRCLRKVVGSTLAIGEGSMSYHQIVDQITIQGIRDQLAVSNRKMTMQEVRSFVRSIMKINEKRFDQLFRIFSDDEQLLPSLIKRYLETYRPAISQSQVKELHQDIADIISLCIASYHAKLNERDLLSSNSRSIEQAIQMIYSDQTLSLHLGSLLEPLLLHEDEQVQKLAFSQLLSQAAHYAKAMAKTIQENRLPTASLDQQTGVKSILIVDFTPHMLKYAFSLIERPSQQVDGIAYSLGYKLAKSFEATCLKIEGCSGFIGLITEIVVNFIKHTFSSVRASELQIHGDTSGSLKDKSLYTNLVLCNIFMQTAVKDTNLKIKGSPLGLAASTQTQIIEALNHDPQTLVNLKDWITSVIRSFSEAFISQKCSYRIKQEEGLPVSVYEVLSQNESSNSNGLLRPINDIALWKWHPLFISKSGGEDQMSQFELLDRKIPAQILLLIQFVIGKCNLMLSDNKALIEAIRDISYRKPTKVFLKQLGEQAISTVLAQTMSKDTPDIIQKFINKEIKGSIAFDSFYETYETLYCKHLTKKGATLTFNQQFLLHSILQKTWKQAQTNSESWRYFLHQSSGSPRLQERSKLIHYLFESAFILNDDSAQLCLQLCALAYDSSVVLSFSGDAHLQISLFSIFQREAKHVEKDLDLPCTTDQIDVTKLIYVMLLGRNKKQLRLGAAHLLKGLYDRSNSSGNRRIEIRDLLIARIPRLCQSGVNSMELVALLSYIVNTTNEEIEMKHLSKDIFNEIQRTNQQLTAHENLELYAVLQLLTTSFNQGSAGLLELGGDLGDDVAIAKLQEAADLFGASALGQSVLGSRGGGGNSKISNPYLLENEACQKCFSQRSLPFSQNRVNDIKTEAKFTDSTMIYRFNTTYLVKQIQIHQDSFRGNKVIKEINVYVNNKQGVDLADMKNNMSLWKKVKSQEVEVGQRQILIDFTLPVNASNLLIEYTTGNVAKIMSKVEHQRHHKQAKGGPHGREKAEKTANKVESIHDVSGIDSVLMTLPKALAAKLGHLKASSSSGDKPGDGSRDENGQVIEKDQIVCPRCGKVVQGRHGICNQCGENAQQCQYCRNINYEKPDGFLCNECGMSRYCKLDLQFTVKQGFACEKIESEEAKTQALNQIESNLATAQNAYSQLMKKRTIIAELIKRMNESRGSESGRHAADMYLDECADLYQKMMKSLNSIKILKIEIDHYTSPLSLASQQQQQNQQQQQEDQEMQDSLSLVRGNSLSSKSKQGQEVSQSQQQETCFSCIQEYLKGLLSFIQATSDKLADLYKSQGYIDLLYKDNLKMYSALLQDPARRAICSILKRDENETIRLLEKMIGDLFSKRDVIPAHQLGSNINQETALLIDLLKVQAQLRGKPSQEGNFYDTILDQMWIYLFRALKEGLSNSAIADQVAGSIISYIKDVIKTPKKGDTEDKTSQQMKQALLGLFQHPRNIPAKMLDALNSHLQGQNFLIYSLTLSSSQRVRQEAKEIISFLASENKSLHADILKNLLSILDQVLQLDSSCGDQYFDLLQQILSPETVKEKITADSLSKTSATHIYVEAFDMLFKQIDKELVKLIKQEAVREQLGMDGFMPQISTGQIFARVVSLVQGMIKESVHLKSIVTENVNIVIKSFLKIRKLNLTKNKLIQQSEVEIEKMFKELHSQREEEKEKFILECIKLIESAECDFQEMRFLFEEVCKVIDPVKPEPEYLLNLSKAQSQEFYFRGKMSKNPYTSTSLGKTMGDVRLKICKEMELAEPELVELLVAGKLVGMDLPIRQVYEQVHWPALCRQRNPDAYDIPPIEEAPKSQLNTMTVTFRLMGIDGEATEDRVESLQDGSEADMDPANIQKKYGFTSVLCKDFESKRFPGTQTTGVKVLIEVLETFGPLQKQRYLAEWLFKLIGFALKIKSNRVAFMQNRQTADNMAKRLFESVGMQSQTEGQKGQTLFDVILVILEQIIGEEVTCSTGGIVESEHREGSGDYKENQEAASHVEIFIQILSESCEEMVSNHQGLEKTSKKIRAISKILPFLINKEDRQAQQIIIDFIAEALTKIPLLDQLSMMTAKEKFTASFNIERVIEILESTPVSKNYLKDKILENCGQLLESMWNFLLSTTLVDLTSEQAVQKHKLANQYTLRLIHCLLKNHPESQAALYQSHHALVDKIYDLTQVKFKDRLLTILAQDVVESFTNKNNVNDQRVKDHLQRLIDRQQDEKKRLAQKKKEEIMRQMQAKKNQNKFVKQLDSAANVEETGPKCIVCHEGYTKKPTEVLGMYVFSKKLKISEVSSSGSGFTSTLGYQTVTHSNFIHFVCHQNAYRADSQMKQPKKEWEGAVIRNDHTKCNNLFPFRGGNLPVDSYAQMIDRYFQVLAKSVGQCDPDRVKVMLHDFKVLLKKLAYEDSFSRDTHGGGPEHNMHLVPFMFQMISQLLQGGGGGYSSNYASTNSEFTFVQEQRIAEFLEQGTKLKKDFLQRLEEEKRADEIEEEEKLSQHSEDESKEDLEEDMLQLDNFSLDHVAFMLSQCVIFCQNPRWEQYKYKFLSIILCTVANNVRENKRSTAGAEGADKSASAWQTEFATGKRVLTINKSDDVVMAAGSTDAPFSSLGGDQTHQTTGDSKGRRRLSSDLKVRQETLIQQSLIKLRPLLVLMRLVDALKQRWDAKRLGLLSNGQPPLKHSDYLRRIEDEFLARGSLQEVIADCDEIFRDYKDRILKTASVEEFLQDMNMLDTITQGGAVTLEQFITSHFTS